MKLAIQQLSTGSTWICLALLGGLLAGCSSPSTQNRRVYDRYAALVAERNQALQSSETSKAKKKASASSRDSLNRRPVKKSTTAKNAAKPKKTSTSKKQSTPKKTAVVPDPVPAPAPPVQVVAPKPAREVVRAPAVPTAVAPAAPAPEPVPSVTHGPASDSTGGYRLKVGDGIQIFLRGIPQPEAIEDMIDEVGMIALPYINEVKAAGLTASELERQIQKTYLDMDIYRNISVNVVVPTRYYFVQGEIRAPGRFQILSATRVSQAIAGAGGYTEYASGQVLIKRNGKIVKTIRNARRLERSPGDDILLQPDDIVEVRRSIW